MGPDEPPVTISGHTAGIHRRNCVTWIPQSPSSSETYILAGEEKLPKGNDFKTRTKPDVPAVFGKLRQIFCNKEVYLSSQEKAPCGCSRPRRWKGLQSVYLVRGKIVAVECELQGGKVAKPKDYV